LELTKEILCKLFNFAFFSQSFDAEVTSSTEITSLAPDLAKIIPIVPVQPYKSKTICSFNLSLFAKSKTIE
jgi:hypothetical protein